MIATITMDAAGRLVVPKAMRERFGLVGRISEIEAEETPEGIVLRPRGEAVPAIRRPSGWVVFDSGEPESNDPVTAVEEERAKRHEQVLRPD